MACAWSGRHQMQQPKQSQISLKQETQQHSLSYTDWHRSHHCGQHYEGPDINENSRRHSRRKQLLEAKRAEDRLVLLL